MKITLKPDEVFEACREMLRERGLWSPAAEARMSATADGPIRNGVQPITITFECIEFSDVVALETEESADGVTPTTTPEQADSPSCWQGNDAGVAGVLRALSEVLDGPIDAKPCFGGADVQQFAERLLDLRRSAASAHKGNVELERAILDFVPSDS